MKISDAEDIPTVFNIMDTWCIIVFSPVAILLGLCIGWIADLAMKQAKKAMRL